jgi:hypothetical protein
MDLYIKYDINEFFLSEMLAEEFKILEKCILWVGILRRLIIHLCDMYMGDKFSELIK